MEPSIVPGTPVALIPGANRYGSTQQTQQMRVQEVSSDQSRTFRPGSAANNCCGVANTSSRYRDRLGPSGPELQIESKMSSWASQFQGPKKSKTKSKKSQNQLVFNYFDSFSTPFWTFLALRPRGPGNSFSDSICNLDTKGPNDPVAGPGNRSCG